MLKNRFVEKLAEIQRQEETYPSSYAKLLRYFKLILTGKAFQFTNFEKLVLKEPNDCSIVLKFLKIEEFRINKTINDSFISSVYVCALRIPHPLRRHIGKLHNVNLEENSKTLNFENLQEKVDYLRNLPSRLDELPVIVVIHGLGGQLSQFEDLLMLLSQSCDCFGIDLPGFGHSRFTDPVGKSMMTVSEKKRVGLRNLRKLPWSLYETDSIVELLATILESDPQLKDRSLVLVGHSMGSHIVTKLNTRLNKSTNRTRAMVILSPPDLDSRETEKSSFTKLHFLLKVFVLLPFVLNLLRVYDRLGGLYSGSILRMVGREALLYTRIRQIRWNLDSDTHAWLRYVEGFQRVTKAQLLRSLWHFKDEKQPKVLLICGDEDKATPVTRGFSQIRATAEEAGIPLDTMIVKHAGHSIIVEKPEIVSGMVMKFFTHNVNEKLNPAFVLTLQAIVNGDKWGLKNLSKWRSVQAVSEKLVNPSTKEIAPLLAMKTPRNNDELHSPGILESLKQEIVGIIDISATGTSDSYDPQTFSRIKYRKLATVSKIPPDSSTVRKFIDLVDELLDSNRKDKFVVVHCHYGFNRTGYLICCYLIEKLGWRVSDALEAFKRARAPGIKHPHFIDDLHLRYEEMR